MPTDSEWHMQRFWYVPTQMDTCKDLGKGSKWRQGSSNSNMCFHCSTEGGTCQMSVYNKTTLSTSKIIYAFPSCCCWTIKSSYKPIILTDEHELSDKLITIESWSSCTSSAILSGWFQQMITLQILDCIPANLLVGDSQKDYYFPSTHPGKDVDSHKVAFSLHLHVEHQQNRP
jgi:hypothetical protein